MRIPLFLLSFFILASIHNPRLQAENPSETLAAITLENINDLTVLDHFDMPKPVVEVAWFPNQNDKMLVSTTESLFTLDVSRHNFDALLEGYMESLRFIADTSQIAMWDKSELVITVYDLKRSIPVKNIFVSGTTTINDTGTLYASGGIDAVEVYDLQMGQLVREFPVTQYSPCDYACPIHGLAFSPNSNALVFASAVPEVESAMVNIETGQKIAPFELGSYDLVFNNDGSLLASTSAEPGYLADKFLLTDTTTGKAIVERQMYVSSIGFDQSRTIIAIGAFNENSPNPDEATGYIYFFDVNALMADANVKPIMMLDTAHPPSAIKFSDDDQLIAIGYDNGNLNLWGVPSTE